MSAQHAIEHPESIGSENKQILDTLTDAYRACLELAEQGFNVIKVKIEGDTPIILIEHSKKCRRLNGIRTAWRNSHKGREQLMLSVMKGCKVNWVVRGS